MADDIIDLRSVNWSQGMFLTPDHFTRQEKYFDSMLLWMMRYASLSSGLVGGGPRVQAAERGAARFDPIADVDDSGDTLKIAVTQARGVTSGGAVIDIDPANALSATFPKRDVEGSLEVGIYIVTRPHDKQPDAGIEDPINPQMQTAKRARYRISLEPTADEAPWSLLLTRIRRSERGLRFERVPGFIPPCTAMSSHSELMYSFRELNEKIAAIADHYGGLHRAIVDFVPMARARSLNVEQDLETLSFVSRMVMTLEECAYRIIDPLKPPVEFFKDINQLIRSAALFLSLSPPTKEYFRSLAEIGEKDFTSLLEQESEALMMGRGWSMHDDLGVEVRNVTRALERLDILEQALEGKYMDYRISPSLERINFVFDRTSGEPILFKTVAKPARPQAMGQEVTFVFAPLQLETREKYRVIIIGDKLAKFNPGDVITAEIRVNRGEGYSNRPEFIKAYYEIDNQRNFALDFTAPSDIVSINDVRVSFRSSQPIRSAILYVRARFVPQHMVSSGGARSMQEDAAARPQRAIPPPQPYEAPPQRVPVPSSFERERERPAAEPYVERPATPPPRESRLQPTREYETPRPRTDYEQPARPRTEYEQPARPRVDSDPPTIPDRKTRIRNP
jgi:hypothetical protein